MLNSSELQELVDEMRRKKKKTTEALGKRSRITPLSCKISRVLCICYYFHLHQLDSLDA